MLHRPYIRSDVRAAVEARAARNEKGQFLDANTGKPIEGQYDLGHKAGHEFRTEVAKAEKEGLTQAEFNEKMNDPNLYQIEDPSSNRSHQFEANEEDEESGTTSSKSGKSSEPAGKTEPNEEESNGKTDAEKTEETENTENTGEVTEAGKAEETEDTNDQNDGQEGGNDNDGYSM